MVITYKIAGRPVAPQDEPSAAIRFITPNYFKALQVPMVKGREFTDQDRGTSQAVIIINEALARREFPNEDPLGKQMLIGYGNSRDDGQTPRTIIGVVKDMRQSFPSVETRSRSTTCRMHKCRSRASRSRCGRRLNLHPWHRH